jgi:hypothetical protein
MSARYILLSELSCTFTESNASPIYTNNSQNPPTRPPMDTYNPRSRWHHYTQSVQHPIYPGTQPNTSAEPSTPPTSSGTPRLSRQYTRVWDDIPPAQYVPPTPSGWYLSNPIPAVQISPYYAPYLCPDRPPLCNYCGADRGEHPFDQCPHTIACIYCAHDHPGPSCPTPHQSCNPLVCLVPENHHNTEPGGHTYSHWQCPRSGTIKYHY